MSFVVDTYALLEWYVQDNPRYEPYFRPEVERHLTLLTLLEFYHLVYHRMGEEMAEGLFGHLRAYCRVQELSDEIIKGSAAFRSRMLRAGKKPSYADSVSYVTAKVVGARLLTGDREFEGMEDVEFVR